MTSYEHRQLRDSVRKSTSALGLLGKIYTTVSEITKLKRHLAAKTLELMENLALNRLMFGSAPDLLGKSYILAVKCFYNSVPKLC